DLFVNAVPEYASATVEQKDLFILREGFVQSLDLTLSEVDPGGVLIREVVHCVTSNSVTEDYQQANSEESRWNLQWIVHEGFERMRSGRGNPDRPIVRTRKCYPPGVQEKPWKNLL